MAVPVGRKFQKTQRPTYAFHIHTQVQLCVILCFYTRLFLQHDIKGDLYMAEDL